MIGVPHQLSFGVQHAYSPSDDGATVPVSLSVGGDPVKVFAKIDTGATYCFFERGLAEALLIDVERVPPIPVSTMGGTFQAYGHELTLTVLGIEVEALVYFYEDRNATRNVLGRNGWLNRVRLGLIVHDSLLYLSAYDD